MGVRSAYRAPLWPDGDTRPGRGRSLVRDARVRRYLSSRHLRVELWRVHGAHGAGHRAGRIQGGSGRVAGHVLGGLRHGIHREIYGDAAGESRGIQAGVALDPHRPSPRQAAADPRDDRRERAFPAHGSRDAGAHRCRQAVRDAALPERAAYAAFRARSGRHGAADPRVLPAQSVIKALVFDFDGLLVDTEVPIFRAWQRIYREHGQELPLDRWLTVLGTPSGPVVPGLGLAEKTGTKLDEKELKALEVLYYQEATALQQLLPGVLDYLVAARELGLKTAVASSSTRKWVMDHLNRFGIGGHFDAIVCREDVKRTKPHPDLYVTSLERLCVRPAAGSDFPESSNGVQAAKAAGLFCVAVPNPLTADLDLSEADLRLLSLDPMPLREGIKEASPVRKRRPP